MNTQVIISGGGIPGLTLAITLGKAGIRTCVIDPYEPEALETLKNSGQISGHTTALMQESRHDKRDRGAGPNNQNI